MDNNQQNPQNNQSLDEMLDNLTVDFDNITNRKQPSDTAPATEAEGELDDSNLSEDFVIGKDFFIDSSEADNIEFDEKSRLKKKKAKKKVSAGKSCLTSVIWMAAILVIAIAAASLLLYFGMDYLGVTLSKSTTEEIEVVIDEGTSAKEIAEILKEKDIISSSLFFRFYAKQGGHDSKFQYGIYYFSKQDSYEDIAEALVKKGAHGTEVTVTIPEGWTIDQIAERLEANGVCSASDFKAAVNEADYNKYPFEFMKNIRTPAQGVHYKLEGYLFPDTYRFYDTNDKSGAEQAIKKMLTRFDQMVTPEMRARAAELKYSLHDILTLSSVIELESSVAELADKQKVSAVFWNRLNNWGETAKLQSDPTQKYPYNKEKYDTYKAEGLAPGAYCSPSIDSIRAALYPDENCKAYYFVTDKNMKFYFNETYDGHNSTIKKLKKDGLWAE